MKKCILILTLAFFGGCVPLNSPRKPASAISVFEQSMGKQNTRFLNRMLHRFENLLCERYATRDLSGAYRKYIHEMDSTGDFSFLQHTAKGQKLYKQMRENQLSKEMWIMADSCWFDGKYYRIRYVYKKDTSLISSAYPKFNRNEDPELLKHRFRSSNLSGIFYKSLKQAGNYHSFMQEYAEMVEIAGDFPSPSLMMGGLLLPSTDFLDYFNRRLVLINMFFFDLKW